MSDFAGARYELNTEDEYGLAILYLDCSTCRSAAGDVYRAWRASRPRRSSVPPPGPVYRLGRPADLAEAMSLALEHERQVHGGEQR